MDSVNSDAATPAATSTWAALWSGTGRLLRRGSMPLAWAITLGVCAASAFAVRDVVFPSLAPSASPSLWQPQPGDSTSSIGRVTSTADRIEESTALPTTELVVPSTDPVVDTSQVQSQSPSSGSGTTSGARPSIGPTPSPTTSKPATSPSSVSSAPSTSVHGGEDDDHHVTSTTTAGATSTSSPVTATTVTETTDPVATDTLPGDTGGGTSGSGRGGNLNDGHP